MCGEGEGKQKEGRIGRNNKFNEKKREKKAKEVKKK